MNAKDAAQTAARIAELADAAKPAIDDPYREKRQLIRYHLLSAATLTREIAEALAQKEAQG
jgi:hypothetical protein